MQCADCACFNVRKASRVITQYFDRAMDGKNGLRGTQFSILAVLALSGPSTVSNLSERLVMDRTTLTRNLKPLEKRGTIRLEPGDDLRTRTVTLTKEGEALLATTYPKWKNAQNDVIEGFGRKRFQALLHELRELSAVMAGS